MADVRQLRYFAAAAARLSFSEAALELHISQPALSEAVRKLESELGVQLFDRSSRKVSLTVAGETLLHHVPPVLWAFDDALTQTRRSAHGHTGRLRVGFEAAGAGALNTRARARFAKRWPDVRIEPKRFDWGAEVQALRDRACDVAYAWLPCDLTGLTSQAVVEEPRFAGLAADHRLAARSRLSIRDLDDEPIMWTSRAPRAWVDWWAVNPRPGGQPPRWGPENDNVEEMLEHVAAGSAYCIAPYSMTEFYRRPDLAWIRIDDIDPLQIVLAWRTDDDSPLVSAFAAVARELRDTS